MLKIDVIYSIFKESYAGKTGTTYRTCFSLILTFHPGRYKSFIDVFFLLYRFCSTTPGVYDSQGSRFMGLCISTISLVEGNINELVSTP